MDLTMVRGDTPTILVNGMLDENGVPPSLSGAAAWMTAKKTFADDDEAALFLKKVSETPSADGKIVATGAPETHYVEFYMEPEDTKDVTSKSWRYDVQIVLATGKVYTVQSGKLLISYDITREYVP